MAEPLVVDPARVVVTPVAMTNLRIKLLFASVP